MLVSRSLSLLLGLGIVDERQYQKKVHRAVIKTAESQVRAMLHVASSKKHARKWSCTYIDIGRVE